jgi:hypothetical protein
LEDLRTVGYRSPRETWEAAVNTVARHNVPIPAHEVGGTEKVPKIWTLLTPEPLRGTYSAYFVVFKGSQNPREQCWRPYHVVIGENGNLRFYIRESLAHLATFIGLGNAENPDLFGNRFGQSFGLFVVYIHSHKEDLEWIIAKT